MKSAPLAGEVTLLAEHTSPGEGTEELISHGCRVREPPLAITGLPGVRCTPPSHGTGWCQVLRSEKASPNTGHPAARDFRSDLPAQGVWWMGGSACHRRCQSRPSPRTVGLTLTPTVGPAPPAPRCGCRRETESRALAPAAFSGEPHFGNC